MEASAPSAPAASANPALEGRTKPAVKPNDFDESGWPDEREEKEGAGASLEYEAEGSGEDLYQPTLGRPRRRIFKTVTAAIVLFTVGSVMLWLGVRSLYTDKDRAIAMLVLGALMFIPGSYASFIVLGSCLRWPGYRVEDLPSYDDE